LTLGLAGWGRVARLIHGKVLASLPEISVLAVAEPDATARAEAQRAFPSARVVEDHRRLLAVPGVAAVLVGVPTHLHAEIAADAFRAGRHVYLEKPLAPNLAEGDDVLAAWRAAGTAGMIGFNLRFDGRYLEARRLLAAGEIGRPLAARTVFTTPRRAFPAWKTSRATGGGALLDLGSHDVDLVRFLFGAEIAEVRAELRTVEHEDDLARLWLRLENGVTVDSLACTCAADDGRLDVYGDRGWLAVDRLCSAAVEVRRGALWERSRVRRLADAGTALLGRMPRAASLRGRAPLDSYRAALRAFARAARNGGSCSPDLDDGWRSLAVVVAAEAAAESGSAVEPGRPATSTSAVEPRRPAASGSPAEPDRPTTQEPARP
jgi:myo-inositol 2-dehydrogenase/D-chiro-inositol 1-dehydrogenase